MKSVFLIILFSFSVCLWGQEEPVQRLEKDFEQVIHVAKTTTSLGEPFPVVNIDLTGVPVFSGYSSSLELVKETISPHVLATYSDNEELVSLLTRQAELGDYESAGNLFVLAESTFTPTRRARLFNKLLPIVAKRLFEETDEKISTVPAETLFYVCRYADAAQKMMYPKRLAQMLEIAAQKNDAAFRMQIDLLIKKRDRGGLNRIIANTRASGTEERNFLLDRYSVIYSELPRIAWRDSPTGVAVSRFYTCLRNRSSYAILLAQAMSLDEGKTKEHLIFVDELIARQVREAFPVAAKDSPPDSENCAYYSYLTLRHDFSIDASDALFEYFYKSQDFRNAAILVKYVKNRHGRSTDIKRWCESKEPRLEGKIVFSEQMESELKELIECGAYENTIFEKRFQDSLRRGGRSDR